MATTQRLKRRAPAEAVLPGRGRGDVAQRRRAQKTDFAEALGASRSFTVTTKPRGPFGVAALLEEVKNRLVSRGGRPSDPSPTVRRLVPLKKQVWRRLQMQAERLSGLGKPVSPGQLAAMLLEKSIDDLEPVEQDKSRA